jgi:hypothetical protein
MTRSVYPIPGYDFWKLAEPCNVLGYARNPKELSLIDDIGIEPYIGLQEAVS